MSKKKKSNQRESSLKQTTTKSSPQKTDLIIKIAIGLFAFILYANTLNHGYVLDDFSVIRDNTVVMQGIKAIPTIFKTSYRYGYMNLEDGLYRPLSLAMFATEWEIAPDKPSLSHWVNVILYSISVVLLYVVLKHLLCQYAIVLPLIATLLFTAHPLHTEVVANIKSRDEILSLFFILCSLYVLIKLPFGKFSSLVSGILFFLSLLSKESGITMLAGFPLILWAFKQRKIKECLASMTPHLLLTIIFLGIRYKVLGGKLSDTTVTPLDNFLLETKDKTIQFATAVKVLGLYLKLFIWPHPLLYDYSLRKIPLAGISDPFFIISFIIHAAAFIYAVLKIQNRSFAAVFLMFYFISISLFSNIFIKIGVGMAERLMYFPSVPVMILAAYGLVKICKENIYRGFEYFSFTHLLNHHRWSLIFASLWAVILSILTVVRNPAWKDSYTLYATDIVHLEESTRAHFFLGNELIKNVAPAEKNPARKQELFKHGIEELLKAIKIYPAYAEAISQLAVGYYKMGDYPNAVKYSELALKYNPNDVITINNLGSSLFQTGKPEEAMKYYMRSVELNPNYEDGWMNIGSILGMKGEYEKALNAFKKVLEIN
ncbi:MAG: tetratricopeptide repeat protein, partial [Chitinophagales bacterium]|nr:tetratricopeptide repeat protein [Chitinophagales bacterium]